MWSQQQAMVSAFFRSPTALAVHLICWQITGEIVALASECGDDMR